MFLEHGYTSLLSALGPGPGSGVKVGKLGMGSSNTWHGTPDVRVRGAEIISNEDEEEDDDDNCSSTATIEAKRVLKKIICHKPLAHVLYPRLLNAIFIPINKQPCQL